MKVTNATNKLYDKSKLIPLDISKVRYIIVHHTASSPGYKVEDCQRDHLANGWAGVGYNELIYPNGDVYVCRGMNVGAQCQGSNSVSYGISLVGNFDTTAVMPLEQFSSLITRIRAVRPLFPNFEGIKGHKELGQTSCPGQFCNLDMIKECGMIDE